VVRSTTTRAINRDSQLGSITEDVVTDALTRGHPLRDLPGESAKLRRGVVQRFTELGRTVDMQLAVE
jgi:hypothetical protein